jgi:hypothetical protein
MNLYIRRGAYRDSEPWWEKFSKWANQQPRPERSLKELVELRRSELRKMGAELKYETDTGLPYLEFENPVRAAWFLLKWS